MRLRSRFAAFAVILGVGALAGLAGCTSGGTHHAGAAAPSSAVASPSPVDSPVIDPQNQAVDSMTGTARISFSTGSSPVPVATSADEPAQVSVDASGQLRVEWTMHGQGGALFSLEGPAGDGSASHDHVTVLMPSLGVLLDTDQGNVCAVRYTKAAETGVTGTASCDAEEGAQRYTVTVTFAVR